MSIKVGIHKSWHKKIDPELKVYKDILIYNDIEYCELDSSDLDFWKNIREINFFIFKWGHIDHHHQLAKTILPIIENDYKIKCFPNQATCWHYDDKIKQYLLLKAYDFPAVKSWMFWDKEKALNWIKEAQFPLVFKLKGGAGGISVQLVYNKKDAIKLINRIFRSGIRQGNFGLKNIITTYNFNVNKIYRHYAIRLRNKVWQKEKIVFWQKHKNYIYFQEYLPGNDYDTRVTTAGLRAHAFRRFVRKNDFRASGSDKWDINPENIDKRMVEIALKISKHFGFQSMAYDFIYDDKHNPKIIEMSYLYGGAGNPDFSNGYWDENLVRHEGRFWPQYFELVDLLQMNDLKLPPNISSNTSYSKVKIA